MDKNPLRQERASYAFSLFAIVDRSKVDTSRDLPESFADQLQVYLRDQCGVESLSIRFLRGSDEVLLVLNGVPQDSIAALLALTDVQKTQLFLHERDAEDQVTLVPVHVSPE